MIRKLAVAVLLLAAGCGAAPEPTPPTPTSASSATSSSAAPPHTTVTTPRPTTAPEITRPINIDRFAEQACDSLTPQQVDSLGLTGLNRISAIGLCRWSEGEFKEFDVRFNKLTSPLVLSYQEANSGRWPVFEPMELGGFPALKLQTGAKVVPMCNVVVGTGASQGIQIIAQSQEQGVDWCAKAIAAAGYVIGNLRS